MTVKELIEQLEEIPESRRDEEVHIFICGRISGMVEIARVDSRGTNWITIDSRRMSEISDL